MKNVLVFGILLIAVNSALLGQDESACFISHPTLTPDGRIVIFGLDGDLWQVNAAGGKAMRITGMEGKETHPKVSPDGKWLTFTASQYGNQDVYLMPFAGGEAKQLTYHQANDQVAGWSWDSNTIYFTSNRYNGISSYRVSVYGDTPSRLFSNYFNNVHNLVQHPKDESFYFNETWESNNFANRKRYKGPYNPDIKSYNPKTKEYKQHTNYEGKDFWTTIDKNGTVYFVSDEYNGEYNLYTFDRGKKKRLTGFDSSIKHPFVSANGEKIVFEKDYQLFVYDVKKNKSKKVDVQVLKNNTLSKTKDFDVKGKISAFDIADDNKKITFVSRGELFISDIKGKYVRQLKTRPDGRVSEAYWLKDNKSIIFNQTVNGYQNWFRLTVNGEEREKQLTDDLQNNRNLAFNSDKTKAVYLSGRNEVRLLDLETFKSEKLLEEELWGFYNDYPQFAPDDRHILFTAYRNFERDIFVHDLEAGQTRNITRTGISEVSPFWSPDGKYIYFSSDLTHPNYPYGIQDANLYRFSLQKYDKPYRSDKLADLFQEDEKDDEEDAKEKEEKENVEEDKKKKKTVIEIEEDGLLERIERIGPALGNQGFPFVVQNGQKTLVIYGSNHDEGRYNLWMTTLEPFEKPKTEKIAGASTGGTNIEVAKDNYYLGYGGDIYILNLDGKKVEKIDIDFKFSRQLQSEFEQMFYETWANMEENFYDENFHGLDWAATRDRYAAFLPFINDRDDLRRLLNDMLGELNTSHYGFYSNGPEEKIYYGSRSFGTGILFEEDEPFRVARIIKDSPADRKDKDIRPGDVLVKVNDQPIDPATNRETYFAQPSLDEEVALTFRRGDKEKEVKLHPVSYGVIRNLLYDEWEDNCQNRVDQKTNKRIAYIHMKNMGTGALNRFLREMVAEWQHRDALILDLRYNTGGNVHDPVLRFLSQKPYLQWKYREGELTPQSNFGPAAKPMVLLINEQSLSDAEMTATGFKELQLGKVIGTGTYRWIIFTSGKGLVDGSFYRLPAWGCYTLDGKNIEKTGVEPDIYVKNTFKDRLEGKDPQLDRAIEEVMKMLR